MALIEWKGINWSGAYGELGIKELLTGLKGYAPIELLEFEKNGGAYRGRMTVGLSEDGIKIVTLYELRARGPEARPVITGALKRIREIFGARIFFVDDPSVAPGTEGKKGCYRFWIQMLREGFIDGIESETLGVNHDTPLDQIEEKFSLLSS